MEVAQHGQHNARCIGANTRQGTQARQTRGMTLVWRGGAQASIVAALESDFGKVQALVEEAVRHLSARPGTGSTVRDSFAQMDRLGSSEK
jgi:hypothetical protein